MLKLRTTVQIDALVYCDVPRDGSSLERARSFFDVGVKDTFGGSQSTWGWARRYLALWRARTHCYSDPRKHKELFDHLPPNTQKSRPLDARRGRLSLDGATTANKRRQHYGGDSG